MNLLNLSLRILGKENEGSLSNNLRITLQKTHVFPSPHQYHPHPLLDFCLIRTLYFILLLSF